MPDSLEEPISMRVMFPAPYGAGASAGPELVVTTPERVAAVRLVDTTKVYGTSTAADNVSLEIARRELFTLLGPSGSGKTTVLRMIAGLIKPTSGQIWIGDREVHETATYERDIAMVFQALALFPHMSVFGNIAFPLQLRRIGKREIQRRVHEVLDVVRLPDIAKRRVNELSGGQQQRVALARALVYQPQLLLLDEPLGALDRRLREEMQLEIVRLHQELDVTIVNVTHDQREALMLSDRIGVMRAGRLEQVGTTLELYNSPATRFVAEFVGDSNILDGVLKSVDPPAAVMPNGAEVFVNASSGARPGDKIAVVVRAESVRLTSAESSQPGENSLRGIVQLKAFEGPATYYEVQVDGLAQRLKVSAGSGLHTTVYDRGDQVYVTWSADQTPVLALTDAS
ncbi:MAG: ABC transporter ATP-binding protein [Actinomycetota bacterium]